MSTLVKAHRVSIASRRAQAGREPEVPPPLDSAVSAGPDVRVDELEHALEEGRVREAALKERSIEQERKAYAEGVVEGERLAATRFEKDWTRQQDALRDAVTLAVERVDEHFIALERFALDLAEAALARVIGDTTTRRDLLIASIAHHVGLLAADTVVAVRVSAEDLPDDAAVLASLAPSIAARTRLDLGLAAGQCRVELRNGSLDLDLDEQAGRLARTFASLRRS